MKISERIQAARHAFSDTKAKPDLDSELGGTGDYYSTYNSEETRSDTTSIESYRRMLDNDGTAEGLYKVVTLPIKAAKYHFTVEDGGDAELQFVSDNFTLPPHKGGMTTPMGLVLADLLRSVVDGYRLFEKVFTLNDKGQIIYHKLAPRDPLTLTLKRDPNGGFAGARQRWWNGKDYMDVILPTERCFLFTYGKEFSSLYGRPGFKSAYYHYDKKHRLYHLDLTSAQVNAIKPRKLRTPESPDASTLQKAESAADRLGMAQRITLPAGWDVEEYAADPLDVSKSIDHHNLEMSRSFLAQFMMLGDGKSGSYALSKDQSELFVYSLQGLMTQIEEHINSYLIPDLINYNFGSGIYPEFHFEEISDETKSLMSKAYDAILKRPDLPAGLVEGIAKEMEQELGIDGEQSTPNLSDKPKERKLADRQYGRELTEAEKRVNLADLEKRMNGSTDKLFAEVSDLFATIKDEALKSVQTLIKNKNIAGLKDFDLPKFNQYRIMLEQAMMEQYLASKRGAADELGLKIPPTPASTKSFIKTQAQMMADKQKQDLIFIVKSEITKELRKVKFSTDLGAADIIARIASAFSGFLSSKVSLGVETALIGAINVGRRDVFESTNEIAAMEFSAVLDGRTSELCRSLDGNVLGYEQFLATQWKPPLHFNCRSIWVAVKKDDSFIPDPTGMTPPKGITEPLLHDHVEETDLSDVIDKMDYIFSEFKGIEHSVKQSAALDERAKKLLEELEA